MRMFKAGNLEGKKKTGFKMKLSFRIFKFSNLQLYRVHSYLQVHRVPLLASPLVFLTFLLTKSHTAILPTGHTDHVTFSKQLKTSDYHKPQHHVLKLSKSFTNQFNKYKTTHILLTCSPAKFSSVLLSISLPYLLKASLVSVMQLM